MADPRACGFPDATDTGVPRGSILRVVPRQVSQGPGWTYNRASREVDVTGRGVVLSDLLIHCNLNVMASHVTIKDDEVVTAGAYGISLRHTVGDTVEDSTVKGMNSAAGRVDSAIADLYGDSTGLRIKNNNISAFRSAVQISAGLVTGNYIHNPGYIAGDHTNGVIANGGTAQLTITHNTILNSLGQTDAITINSDSGSLVANKTIAKNLLAGGSYAIYGGAFSRRTSWIRIEGNRFGQSFYPKSGQFGAVAYFAPSGRGNVWAGNSWDTTGASIPAP